MPFVMLRREWPSSFRRSLSLGGKKGERTLVFEPGVASEVRDDEYEKLRPDIGTALQDVVIDEKGKPRIVDNAENAG